MKTNFCAALLLLAFTLSSEFVKAQTLMKEVPEEGGVHLSLSPGTTASVDVSLITRRAPEMEPKDPKTILQSVGRLFGRDDGLSPVISEIRLRWGKLPAKILAKSAFADLYAPDNVKIIVKAEYLLLIEINGGDGAHGYVAEIEVAPYGAVSRRVRNRKSGYEELTQYKYSAKQMQSSIDAVKNGIQ